MIGDADVMRHDLENDSIYPRANTIPAKYQDEVSVIDSMVTKGSVPGGRGVAEYYRLWDDDIANNRLNVSTLLTPQNEIRRPINMMNYLIRRPEAEKHIRLYDDESSYLRGVPITPDEFASMSLEGKIGFLAAQERANHERYLPSELLGNLSIPPEELYRISNINKFDDPKGSVMGPQSIGRGRQTYSIIQDIDKGAPLSELVEKYSGKVKFKRKGGLINANRLD